MIKTDIGHPVSAFVGLDRTTALEWYKEIIYNYCTEVENTFEHIGKQIFLSIFEKKNIFPQGGFLHEKVYDTDADVILRFMSGRLRQYK